jgi:hypothetical protein
MKGFIAATLALLVFAVAGIGQAANTRPCSEWASAQTSNGQTFSNYGGCASYTGRGGVLYKPTLTVDLGAVNDWQSFTFSTSGFHASTGVTLSWAHTGEPPFVTFYGDVTNADGTFSTLGAFFCAEAPPPYDMTFTLTDAYGVHASARATLC